MNHGVTSPEATVRGDGRAAGISQDSGGRPAGAGAVPYEQDGAEIYRRSFAMIRA